MESTPNGWRIFDASTPILSYEYTFGPGSATAIAVGSADGLFVVSPPCGVPDGVYDDLARYGKVSALIAPNAFHHLGLAAWHKRFPSAPIHAPAQAIARVQQKTGLQDIRPLSDLAPRSGTRLELVDLPHCKTGELLVRVKSERGLVWFVADVVTNMPVLPDHPLARLVFKLSGSAPGLKFNNLAGLVMVKDKKALKQWLASQIDTAPPRWFIPSHGTAVELSTGAQPLRAIFGPA